MTEFMLFFTARTSQFNVVVANIIPTLSEILHFLNSIINLSIDFDQKNP